MAKLSIEVTGKIRSALFVLAALWEQGPSVARLVGERLRPSLEEGEEPPDFLEQIRGLVKLLQAALDPLVELDGLSVAENQRRAALLDHRQSKIGDLGRRITGVRRIITGHYAEPDLGRLGLEGRTARESIALLRQSERICQQLMRDDLAELLGESLFEPPLDPQPFEPQILPLVDDLCAAFEAHQRSRRRVDQLLVRKKEAVTEYDTVFIRVARQFEDMCRLADLDELADKVRPSLTRRGETAIEPPEGEAPGTGADPSIDAVASGPAGNEPADVTVPVPAAAAATRVASAAGDVPGAESDPAAGSSPDA